MYRPSPIRNPRSKGFKTKNVLQVCLLLAVCFWLIFQVKRSHDKKKEFDNTTKDLDKSKISLNTNTQSNDEAFKLGRKDLPPKLEKDVEIHEENEEQDDEQQDEEKVDEEKVDEEKIDEEKIDEEKEDGGGGGDDEIDENEQEKSDVEVDKDEPEVIDEESQTEVDHEENGASVHTHEGREENYKADDASSAVVTQLNPENGTLEEISKSQTVNNETSLIDPHENGPPSNTLINTSKTLNVTGEGIVPNQTEESLNSETNESSSYNEENEGVDEGEKMEGREEILDPEEVENETHLEEKEVRMDLDTLPEIETEGGNSEDSAVERR